MELCHYPECRRSPWSRGYCSKHYYILRRAGELPRVRKRHRRSLAEIFQDSYVVNTTTGCWEWSKYIHRKGYPYFGNSGSHTHVRANRFAYELLNGPIPDGGMVLHHCDNRRCVNPAHLFLGDALANMLDCIAKGRNTHHRTAFRLKILPAMARCIRILYARGASIESLAITYAVDEQTISNIVKGRSHLADV